MLPLVLFLALCDFALAFPKLPGFNLLPGERNIFEERQAEAQPTCSCESLDPGASAFIGHAPFATAASTAPTPSGYVNVFTNENSYCNAEGGLGFTTLDAYDSELCADLCNTVDGCTAFTLYYEKDSGNYQGSNVASSALIKCAFWSGPVAPSGSNSRSSDAYNAIIAGSNGYNQAAPNVVSSKSPSTSTAVSATGFGGPHQGSSASSGAIPTSTGWSDVNGGSHGGSHGGSQASPDMTSSIPAPSAGHGSWPGESWISTAPHTTGLSSSASSTLPYDPTRPTSSSSLVSSVPSTSAPSGTWTYGGHGGPGAHSPTLSSSSSTPSTTSYGPTQPTSSSSLVSSVPSTGTWPHEGHGGPGGHPSWTSETSMGYTLSTQSVTPVSVSDPSSSTTTSSSSTTVYGTYTHSSTTPWGAHGNPWGPHVTSSSSSQSPTTSRTTSALWPAKPTSDSGCIFQINKYNTESGTPSYIGFYDGSAVEVDTIAEAATFQLHDGHLKVGDNYLGTDSSSGYEAMALFDEAPKVSEGWKIGSGQSLEFQNSDFTFGNGEAGFCASTYGSLYIEFTDEPSFICHELGLVCVAPVSVSTTTSSSSTTLSTSSTTHVTPSPLTTASTTPGWPDQVQSHGIWHHPTTTRQPYSSTTSSSSLTTTTSSSVTSSSSSSTTPILAEPTGSTNESSYGGGLPSIFLNSTHLIYNETTNMVYCEWTGLWYPYTANFSLASLNLTSYTLPSNTSEPVNTNSTTTTPQLPLSTTTASPTGTSVPTSNTTYDNSTGYPTGYNASIPWHMVYNPGNNSWFCELTGLWYPADGNFSLLNFNSTLPISNYTLNSTEPVTTTSSTVANPTSTGSPTSTASSPANLAGTGSNSTGVTYPSYNTTGGWSIADFNSSHLIYSASNNSIFCTITGLWYPAGNFSLASLNLTGNYTDDSSYGSNYTLPSDTASNSSAPSTSVDLSAMSTTTSSELPSATSAPGNSTAPFNISGVAYPSFNYSSLPFNASHFIYNPGNDSLYCELTGLWYPAGNVSDIAGFNISTISNFNGTLPTDNYTLPSAATSTSSSPVVPSATPAPDNSTANATYSGGESGYGSNFTIPSFNLSSLPSHIIYSPSNDSYYCEYT